jgi:N-acyl-D-amino-acid deacylase
MEFDILIKNGSIIDGTGAPARREDIGIRREKIGDIGNLQKAQAQKTIDARGMTVCPGFIDIHGHTDISLLVCPGADSKIMQGITTEVAGNCGDSPGPLSDKNIGDYSKEAARYGVTLDWTDLGGFLARLEGNISINYATLLGLGTLRGAIVGCLARRATTLEKKSMQEAAEKALSQGAYGISTGLTYAPGMYAGTDELSELAKALSRDAVIYATHMRSEGKNILSALEEAARISDHSGVPLQVSHLKTVGKENWGRMPEVLRALDKISDSGIDVCADRYPYTASATGLASILPAWSHVGGKKSLLERLENQEEKDRL